MLQDVNEFADQEESTEEAKCKVVAPDSEVVGKDANLLVYISILPGPETARPHHLGSVGPEALLYEAFKGS